jgi:hypothetical protein
LWSGELEWSGGSEFVVVVCGMCGGELVVVGGSGECDELSIV